MPFSYHLADYFDHNYLKIKGFFFFLIKKVVNFPGNILNDIFVIIL